mgnify:CR=1 FL=1
MVCEENLRRAYQIGAGSWNEAIFTKPIAMVLLLVCAAMLLFPVVKPLFALESKGLLTVVQGRNKKELVCQLTERGKIAVDTHDAYHKKKAE